MKGVIFNILEDFIEEKFGDKTLEDAYEQVEHSDGLPLSMVYCIIPIRAVWYS